MDRNNALRHILSAQLGGSYRPEYFGSDTPLLGTVPELDSMAVVGILTAIEEQFDLKIEDDAISADVFGTFGTLADFVESLTNA